MADNMPLPHYPVRHGVTFPDWTAVTSPATNKALLAIFEAFGMERVWRNYTPVEDRVRSTLLRLYGETGRAPGVVDLAARAGVSGAVITPTLASLKARDLVVLDAGSGRIAGAYPFTDRDTEHRVRLGDRTLNAMCAIDALGVGAMYGRDVDISSRCRDCGAPVAIATSDNGRAIADVQPATAVVWSGIRYEDGCAASSLCTVIAFFCSDAHLEGWRVARHPETTGFRLSVDEALQAGRAIFAPSLAGLDANA
jgi:hypothetical protein